jgi:hypothetical protein
MPPKLPSKSVQGRSNGHGPSSMNSKAGPSRDSTKAPADTSKLSGKHWCSLYQSGNSNRTSDLASPFKQKVERFVQVLRDNKAVIVISSTLRSRQRAYLMHWSWKIANGKVKHGAYPTQDPFKMGILWDHGNEQVSRAKAREMVQGYNISAKLDKPPSASSRHTEGNGIDMTITNLPKALVFEHDGKQVSEDVSGSSSGDTNKSLHQVGEKYFGVIKAKFNDPPHWSTDGH